ncbi:GNAT family N-acetyltransferase [Ureibacillus sp. 179-F W5.1 NHS]|uniref:GNAT family N-acetyltransferase n=1 Tax=Ureibacillus sp. 179-F W5.1 NHS TaxID=3374297 RepID=UPI003879AEF7
MLSDLELMRHHVKVLFKHNTENRITVVNEPPYDVAPLVFIGTTRDGSVVRYSNSLNADIVEKLEHVTRTNPTDLGKVIKVLSIDYELNDLSFGPAYVFPNVRERSVRKAIKVTYENKELLKPHFPYTFEDFDYKQSCFVIVEDNIVVSICCSARKSLMADEASVFTHEDYRGRSYGIDVTNAWAAEVQKQGRIALYSTSWNNFVSQSLARKLQLIQYGTDIQIS